MSNHNTAETFWAKVDRSGGCWPWTGPVMVSGYGRFRLGAERCSHRVAHTVVYGAIPPGLVVRHLCHNRLCCNPGHLTTGTKADNTLDMLEAGRGPSAHKGRSAKLSAADVARARVRVADGETQRSVAADMGIAENSMSRIIHGVRWGWVGADSRASIADGLACSSDKVKL